MYVAGSNVPGYLPEDSSEFDCFDDAKRFIISEMGFSEDCAESEEEAENISAASQDVNLERGPFSVTVANRAYWVSLT